MTKFFLLSGPLYALLGIVARSLSSHAIKDFLVGRGKLDNFNLAADYFLVHGVALLVFALLCNLFPEARFYRSGYMIFTGVLLFSGTVLVKSCVSIGPLGIATPIGGAILMAGWLYFFIQAALSQ
jgi:uncharacterized membrane protein YgdD (TMEM256/DUF423 family)